ncbi:MAG: penicillin-insensitive murein endopeptidase [Geminicoccaceae bacterium]
MSLTRLFLGILFSLVLACTGRAEEPAKTLFGNVTGPAPGKPAPIGSYAKGCLAGGVALPVDGPGWQAVRLSRNRVWGTPDLIAFIKRLAAAARSDGWPGLLIGDMAQPRGGPMRTGHASHQIGLDADIWLTPMPPGGLSDAERETFVPDLMLVEGSLYADPNRLGPKQMALIRRAALDPAVTRIFVHPGIKRALCDAADGDRTWLRKVRAWYGHDRHFHVRLGCPRGAATCKDQEPPPSGDGCGAELDWWFTDEPWKPKVPPPPPKPPLMLADLPAACAKVLEAP